MSMQPAPRASVSVAFAGLTLCAILAAVPVLTHGQAQTPATAPLTAVGSAPRPSPLANARSWGYQLQGPKVATLAASPYDVLVIDYSKDGSDDEALTAAEIASLKKKPDGSRRYVLSYMSIGEAESYRYYWKLTWGGKWYTEWIAWFFAPSWRGPLNKDWDGNYATRYWQDGWQQIILGNGAYLDRILKAGFDGVYLDKIDSSIEPIAKGRATAVDDMRTFVKRIAERGRAANRDFLVVPQNGEELLTDAGYRETIDALGKEDLLFGEFKEKQANPPNVVAKRTALLKLLTADRKPVFAVEYLDDPAAIAAARKTLTDLGFVAHFADRPLDNLRIGDLSGSKGSGNARKNEKR